MRNHPSSEPQLRAFVDKIAEEQPPLSLDAVDFTVHNPDTVRDRYGHVFSYLARVELEVERNVLELRTMLPNPTDVDRYFYEDVWAPQELQHGLILDAVQQDMELDPAPADLDTVSAKMKILGALSHLPGIQPVLRMLYYLTGAATEKAAVLAYSRLLAGLREMGEKALAETVVAPIRRQEPGHFTFYKRSAEGLVQVEGMRPWQIKLTGILRSRSFSLVGANNDEQTALFGGVAKALGLDLDLDATARQFSLVERELLWARHQGMDVPHYVTKAIQDALMLHAASVSRA